MTNFLSFEAESALLGWLLTYLLHSTAFFLMTSILVKLPVFETPNTQNKLWKLALVGGLITASMPFITRTIYVEPINNDIVVYEPHSHEESDFYEGETELDDVQPAYFETEDAAIEFYDDITSEIAEEEQASWSISLFQIMALVWLVFILFVFGKYAFQHFHFFKSLGIRQQVTQSQILEITNNLLLKTTLQVSPRITVSDKLESPIVIGNSEICLPNKAIYHLNSQNQESLLAHEIAHIVRKDYYWSIAAYVVQTIFLFQPLNYLIRKRLETTTEQACDAWAAQITGNSIALAQCLVEIANWIKSSPKAPLIAGMALKKSELTNRIHQLLNHSTMTNKNLSPIQYSLLTLAVVALASFTIPRFSFADIPFAHENHEHDDVDDWHTTTDTLPTPPAPPKPVTPVVPVKPIAPADIEIPEIEIPEIPKMEAPVVPNIKIPSVPNITFPDDATMQAFEKAMEGAEKELENAWKEFGLKEETLQDIEMSLEQELQNLEEKYNEIYEKEISEQWTEENEKELKELEKTIETQMHKNMEKVHKEMEKIHKEMEKAHKEMELINDKVHNQIDESRHKWERIEEAKEEAFFEELLPQLIKDDLVKNEDKFKHIIVKSDKIFINGKEVDDNLVERYKKIISKYYNIDNLQNDARLILHRR